jgi:hypothetical protein
MVHRVYVEMGLNIRRKMERRLPVPVKEPLTWPIDADNVWSIIFPVLMAWVLGIAFLKKE